MDSLKTECTWKKDSLTCGVELGVAHDYSGKPIYKTNIILSLGMEPSDRDKKSIGSRFTTELESQIKSGIGKEITASHKKLGDALEAEIKNNFLDKKDAQNILDRGSRAIYDRWSKWAKSDSQKLAAKALAKALAGAKDKDLKAIKEKQIDTNGRPAVAPALSFGAGALKALAGIASFNPIPVVTGTIQSLQGLRGTINAISDGLSAMEKEEVAIGRELDLLLSTFGKIEKRLKILETQRDVRAKEIMKLSGAINAVYAELRARPINERVGGEFMKASDEIRPIKKEIDRAQAALPDVQKMRESLGRMKNAEKSMRDLVKVEEKKQKEVVGSVERIADATKNSLNIVEKASQLLS